MGPEKSAEANVGAPRAEAQALEGADTPRLADAGYGGRNPTGASGGAEPATVTRGRTQAEAVTQRMEQVVERGNMWWADERVLRNKGAPEPAKGAGPTKDPEIQGRVRESSPPDSGLYQGVRRFIVPPFFLTQEFPLRIRQLALAGALACAGVSAQAAVVLTEGFDSLAAALASGWQTVNLSPSPGTTWLQGNPAIFEAASGAADSYASANFLGTTAPSGPISNWLITPQLTLDATSTVSFDVRVVGQGFLDTLQVMVSTTGTAPGDFSVIGTYSSSSADVWIAQSYAAGLTSSTPAFVAFHYLVDDVATQGDYLGVDNVAITAVPEPASLLLMGLGVAGLLVRRRLVA